MIWLLITLATGTLAGLLLFRLRFPGGMLVGAVVSVCALNLLTGKAFIYPQAKVLAQIITGTYIGCMITRRDVRQIPSIIRPFLVVIGSLFGLNVIVGLIFYQMTDLDLLTCLFCAMPGGMTDTPLIAMDMGADSVFVTAMQFIRMIFGLSCLPSLVLLADKKIERDAQPVPNVEPESPVADAAAPTQTRALSFSAFLPTLFLGAVGGLLGKASGIPAGAMSLSLILVAAANVAGIAKPMPIWLRRTAQVFSGCCIGVGVTAAQLAQLKQVILPAALLCAAYFLNCIAVGLLIHRRFHIQLRECMLFPSPAGATEMALIAADMGINDTKLAVMQICRLVTVTVGFPQLFRILLLFM